MAGKKKGVNGNGNTKGGKWGKTEEEGRRIRKEGGKTGENPFSSKDLGKPI